MLEARSAKYQCNLRVLLAGTRKMWSFPVEAFNSPRAFFYRDARQNVAIAYQVQMVPKLVFLFNDPEISSSKITVACTILSHLLLGYFNTRDVLR